MNRRREIHTDRDLSNKFMLPDAGGKLTFLLIYIHAYIHTYTYVHTYTHTWIHCREMLVPNAGSNSQRSDWGSVASCQIPSTFVPHTTETVLKRLFWRQGQSGTRELATRLKWICVNSNGKAFVMNLKVGGPRPSWVEPFYVSKYSTLSHEQPFMSRNECCCLCINDISDMTWTL